MKGFLKLWAVGYLAGSLVSATVWAQGNGWTHADIGAVGVTGNSTYDVGTDTYTVSGSGAGISGTTDAFQYMSRTISGDGEIVARVVTQDNTGTAARAGLMIRDGAAAGARHAIVHTTIGNGLSLQSRSTADAASAETDVAGSAPIWLKLVREGTLITGYQSPDGATWTSIDSVNLPLPYEASVGLAVTSGDNMTSGSATFDHVQFTEVAGPSGLSGFYYHGADLTTLRVIRRDGAINFDWAGLPPDAAVEPGDYSVRWKGDVLAAASETYTFYVLADDKVRLWINDQLIIDHWTAHSVAEDSGTIALTQGTYFHVRMEYACSTGSGVAVLLWSSPSLAKEVIPYTGLRNLDLDDDGIPDAWEIAYGLDPLDPTDAAGDIDGDGISNLQEYLNQTSPTDPAPILTLTGPNGAVLVP